MTRRSAVMCTLCVGVLLGFAGPARAFTIWLPPRTLTATDSTSPVVAVARDGTTVVAWSRASGATSVVEAVRRRPGEAYGAPVTLASGASDPRVAMDAAGNATIAWDEVGAGVRAARLPAATGFEATSTVVPGGSGAELAVGAGGTAVILARAAGVLHAAVRSGASGAFAAAAPISAGAVDDPDVAVAPDGHAVAAWVEGERIRVNERPAGGGFAAAGTVRQPDDDAFAVSDPAAAIDGDGRAVVVWTQDLETDATGPYIATSLEPDAWYSVASPPSRSADLATAPGGAVTAAWVRGAFLEVAELPAGAVQFTNSAVSPSTPAANARPAVTVGPDGTTVAAWGGGTAVHAARRAAGTNVLSTSNLVAGAAAGDASAGGDDQGNATAAWLSPGRRVTVASFDNAAPVLSAVTVPASARAGGPAIRLTARASDRIGPVTLRWTFGDGASATGGAVAHAFGAGGAFDVTVIAADAADNRTGTVRRVTVAAAVKPRPPTIARVDARVQLRWRVQGKRIKLERMRLTRMPGGTEADLRCTGRKCPIRRTRIFTPGERGAIDVVEPLDIDQRRFRAGQRLDLRIAAPGHVGQVLRFNLRRGRQPKALARCMPVGSLSIRRSC